jgi:hypothetical protein
MCGCSSSSSGVSSGGLGSRSGGLDSGGVSGLGGLFFLVAAGEHEQGAHASENNKPSELLTSQIPHDLSPL